MTNEEMEKESRRHLKQLRVLKGGHPPFEHGCTRACLQPAGVVEYICTVHGVSVYGDEGCPACLRALKDSLVQEPVASH